MSSNQRILMHFFFKYSWHHSPTSQGRGEPVLLGLTPQIRHWLAVCKCGTLAHPFIAANNSIPPSLLWSIFRHWLYWPQCCPLTQKEWATLGSNTTLQVHTYYFGSPEFSFALKNYIPSFSDSARNLWGKVNTIVVCHECKQQRSDIQDFNILPVAMVSVLFHQH
jgi:hypothetical protein